MDDEKRTLPPIVSPVADPVRRLMEMAAESRAKLSAVADDPVDMDQQAQAAARAAAEIVAADPGIGPAEVVYIGPNADVPDMRYLIVLFGGERAFLFDRIAGRTTIVELNDGGLPGDERLGAKLESARAAAAREKLSKVYVVKHATYNVGRQNYEGAD